VLRLRDWSHAAIYCILCVWDFPNVSVTVVQLHSDFVSLCVQNGTVMVCFIVTKQWDSSSKGVACVGIDGGVAVVVCGVGVTLEVRLRPS
jgi:hypothetical protein